MKKEVNTACRFLFLMLRRTSQISEPRLEKFRSTMEELLCERYKTHWHPNNPLLGSGFRCIRINHSMDPIIVAAARLVGVSHAELKAFPEELTVWIDPNDVCFRIGENGSICDVNEDVLRDMTGRKERTPRNQERLNNIRKKESMLHSNRDIMPVQTCVQC
ncbi:protein BTG2-like [Actinia tenebrosa]|uniref:Protein BTG2-like n=1 Tax=Actinia tenebrosa TaxID=6105 RepID=A0A6P8HB43_ACTTE|nr:protein BTG2-like [Actinia tenebrosa]